MAELDDLKRHTDAWLARAREVGGRHAGDYSPSPHAVRDALERVTELESELAKYKAWLKEGDRS